MDHHLSKADQLTLSGGRTSLEFAGCSSANGKDDFYFLDAPDGIDGVTSNGGETITFFHDGTEIGSIGPTANRSQIQRVTLTGATSGTFTLGINGTTSDPIAWNAPAAAVMTALGSVLASNGRGVTGVTGNDGGPWDLTWYGTTEYDLLTATDVDLDAGTLSVTEVQSGVDWPTAFRQAWDDAFHAIPFDPLVTVDRWVLRSPAAREQTVAVGQDQTYTLTLSGDGIADIVVGPLTYQDPNPNLVPLTGWDTNWLVAIDAINAAVGTRCVTGGRNLDRAQDIEFTFLKDGCPAWPMAVAITAMSDPGLFSGTSRDLCQIGSSGGSTLTFYFNNALGCRNLNLSASSSPNGYYDNAVRQIAPGDSRYHWTAYWYLRDPAEVVTFGESLTVSGPDGLLAGFTHSGATGDQTAAFSTQAVTNRSWAGSDGDVSPDLCHVTDAANGVDDGWSRWRTEPPPAGWHFTNMRSAGQSKPLRIAYIDPGYDGSNRTSRLNDPTRPYTNYELAYEDLRGAVWYELNGIQPEVPRIVLLKKGTTLIDNGYNSDPCYLRGPSPASPSLFSTYWMASDGPEPASYATWKISGYSGSGGAKLAYGNFLIHGLLIPGGIELKSVYQDGSFWDCTFNPDPTSYNHGLRLNSSPSSVRFSLVRTKFYDHWGTGQDVSGFQGAGFQDALMDQCAVHPERLDELHGRLRQQRRPRRPGSSRQLHAHHGRRSRDHAGQRLQQPPQPQLLRGIQFFHAVPAVQQLGHATLVQRVRRPGGDGPFRLRPLRLPDGPLPRRRPVLGSALFVPCPQGALAPRLRPGLGHPDGHPGRTPGLYQPGGRL